jgi:hypothetical protein
MKKLFTLILLLFAVTVFAIPPTPPSSVTGLTDASNVAITGGNINNTTIGGTTPAAGTFSSLLVGVNAVLTLLNIDDTKGNGDTAYVWSADKSFDQLALKQDADADLTTYAGITPSANVQTLLGSADYATFLDNVGSWGLSGVITDEQLVCIETTGGHNLLKSCGAKTTYTEPATNIPICRTGAATTGGCTNITDVAYLPAAGTGLVERIGATFVGTGVGGVIEANQIAYTHVPYAVTTVNQWTVVCDVDSGATGIIITPYMDAYAADTLPTTTMCTTGTAPHTTDGAGAGGSVHQASWDCNITAIPADSIIGFKVTTAPTSATACSVTLKVTR